MQRGASHALRAPADLARRAGRADAASPRRLRRPLRGGRRPADLEQHPARDRHLEPVSRQFFDETLASRGALLATDAATRRAIGSSRFLFFVSPGNFRSQRAVEKVGGELEPERDAEGRLVYRITASAFARREAQQGPPLARS
jgi:hypothetical protein